MFLAVALSHYDATVCIFISTMYLLLGELQMTVNIIICLILNKAATYLQSGKLIS